jgi:hypothetical protein
MVTEKDLKKQRIFYHIHYNDETKRVYMTMIKPRVEDPISGFGVEARAVKNVYPTPGIPSDHGLGEFNPKEIFLTLEDAWHGVFINIFTFYF